MQVMTSRQQERTRENHKRLANKIRAEFPDITQERAARLIQIFLEHLYETSERVRQETDAESARAS